jgi:hypothetical protein
MKTLSLETKTKIEELKAEYPADWKRSMRRQYLFSYYRKAFRKVYLKSNRYVEDIICKAAYYLRMQEKAVSVQQFETAFLMAEKVKEHVQKLKKIQDSNYYKRLAGKSHNENVTPEQIDQARRFPMNQLIKIGRYNTLVCPFHADSRPSMKYYPETNKLYCFSCHRTLDSIGFVMAREGLNFKDAVRRLI